MRSDLLLNLAPFNLFVRDEPHVRGGWVTTNLQFASDHPLHQFIRVCIEMRKGEAARIVVTGKLAGESKKPEG